MGSILFLALPMLAAAIAYGLRRWRNVPPLMAVGVCLVLGLALVILPFDRPVQVLGREIMLGGELPLLGRALVMGPLARGGMIFLFLAGGGFFLLAWQLEPEGLFVPLGLGLLGLLGGVLLVRPLVYAALLLQIAAALSIFPLHSDPRSPTRGGLRYLVFFTLALPGLLVSHWLLDRYAITPDQTGLLYTAIGLIGFSFALMLGVVPFHPWVPTVGRDGVPLVSAFLFSITGGVIWFLLLDYMQTYPWLNGSPQWSMALTTLGIIAVVVGGLFGTTQRGPGTLLGYGIIVDTGMMLVALAQSSRTGVNLTVAMVFARAWSTGLMAAGMSGFRSLEKGEDQSLMGLGLRVPWSMAAFVVGGLSLVGSPLTIGFAPRWGLYRLIFRTQPMMALVLLAAALGPMLGLLRLFYLLLKRPPVIANPWEEEPQEEPPPEEPAESLPVVVILVLFIVVAVLLGLFPQGLASAAANMGATFSIFGP